MFISVFSIGIGSRREAKIPNLVHALQDEKIVQIGAGGDYSMALSDRGTLFAWGNNSNGQLGKPPLEDPKSAKGGGGAQDFAMVGGKLVVLSKARNMILKQSLQNSCDVPKPVTGISSGLFNSETYGAGHLHRVARAHLAAYSDTVKALKAWFIFEHHITLCATAMHTSIRSGFQCSEKNGLHAHSTRARANIVVMCLDHRYLYI